MFEHIKAYYAAKKDIVKDRKEELAPFNKTIDGLLSKAIGDIAEKLPVLLQDSETIEADSPDRDYCGGLTLLRTAEAGLLNNSEYTTAQSNKENIWNSYFQNKDRLIAKHLPQNSGAASWVVRNFENARSAWAGLVNA